MNKYNEITENAKKFEEEYGEKYRIISNTAKTKKEKFKNDFPLDLILDMTLEDYASRGIGKDSYCYWLERKLDEIGEMKGRANSKRFGVFYSKKEEDYIWTKKYGDNLDDAFKNVKNAIYDLIASAQKKDYKSIEQNKLAPTVKGKILSVYFTEYYLPILHYEHIDYFIDILEIPVTSEMGHEYKKAEILKFKNKHHLTKEWDNLKYVRFLYETYDPRKVV